MTRKKDYDMISTHSVKTPICRMLQIVTGACTGFDGGFEAMEAIRGPGPR